MNNLSIKELKDARIMYKVRRDLVAITIIDELIAILELKGDQVPYGFIDPNAETGGMWVKNRAREGDQFTAPIFTVPQKPVIPMPNVEKWRKPDEVRAQNAYRILVEKEIEAAGGIVKTK